ncbi:MAG: pyridoxal phosphate-dependent aminotransferase [Deltaproteobacteria bacterium]|nr:pyridoxal phosphate-dependent aminotransferase [Deltaproteobacteria bacterium]
MPISTKVADAMSRASWIRKMFEEGERLRATGQGPVYDFSIGNPDREPPEALHDRLRELVGHPRPGMHRYMPNVGFPSTRDAVARRLQEEFKLPFTREQIVMVTGAGGGLNVVLKALLDPGDEVIVLSPYFVEYLFYVDNHGGTVVKVPTGPEFDIDVEAVTKALTKRTKALVVNTPNNPTGVIYPPATLTRLAEALQAKAKEFGTTIYVISDEPYRRLIYDIDHCPSPLEYYPNTVLVMSHSKDLGLAGERIGYVAVHPQAAGAERLFAAMAFSVRTLGFVNAPALMQLAVETLQNTVIDLAVYRGRRDRIWDALIKAGYEVVRPVGAFYFFPKAPGGDDVSFSRALAQRRVLVVPGSGFGTPGYFRLSFTVPDEHIDAALPILAEALHHPRPV